MNHAGLIQREPADSVRRFTAQETQRIRQLVAERGSKSLRQVCRELAAELGRNWGSIYQRVKYMKLTFTGEGVVERGASRRYTPQEDARIVQILAERGCESVRQVCKAAAAELGRDWKSVYYRTRSLD